MTTASDEAPRSGTPDRKTEGGGGDPWRPPGSRAGRPRRPPNGLSTPINANASGPGLSLLLHGIDSLYCAYYLGLAGGGEFDFAVLREKQAEVQQLKVREGAAITLGGVPFLLKPFGTSSGYPFKLTGEDFHIQCGEFNNPSFYVQFLSQALWRESAHLLHEKFLGWVQRVGLVVHRPERISRVDFSFDYNLPLLDFGEDDFVSRCQKDEKVRESRKVQTFTFGKGGPVRLVVYDKVAEIEQESNKVWFFVLWGQDQDVWRIEWQVRKDLLRQFSISTFADLQKIQGDLLRYLAEEHTTLRVPNGDDNRSGWPLHPLWMDMQGRIRELAHLGVCRYDGKAAALEERMVHCTRSIYGYLKRVAAIAAVQRRAQLIDEGEALAEVERRMWQLHDPLHWQVEVDRRIKEVERGLW